MNGGKFEVLQVLERAEARRSVRRGATVSVKGHSCGRFPLVQYVVLPNVIRVYLAVFNCL